MTRPFGSSCTPARGGRSRPASTSSEVATDGVGMERYRESLEDFDLHFTAWHQQVWKPVITAVNGICAGGGFHWVADADIVIAASDAQFFDPHVSVGQVVAIEAIGLLRKMPAEAVMRMAFMGRYERMSAERAYELGMISQIVDPPENLREEAQKLAETIARNSPAAMAATKRALWGAFEWASPRPVEPEPASWSPCGATPTKSKDPGPLPRSATPNGRSSAARNSRLDRLVEPPHPARSAPGHIPP